MKRFDKATIDEALKYRAEGWSYEDIQAITGVGRTTVVKYATAAEHPPRKRGPKPLFDEATQARAVKLYADEVPMEEICAQTGAGADMVRRWARAANLTMRTSAWRRKARAA